MPIKSKVEETTSLTTCFQNTPRLSTKVKLKFFF